MSDRIMHEVAKPTPEAVQREMDRIRRAIAPGGGGDKEDLISYARDIARLRTELEAAKGDAGTLPLDPFMPAQEMRLHLGEMTAQELRTARAAIAWANCRAAKGDAVGVKALEAGWNACRKSLYAVCEDVDREADEARKLEGEHAKGYAAGMARAAKSIARGFSSMEACDDDNLRSALTADKSEASA